MALDINICRKFAITAFWNFSLPEKRKPSIITPIKELFSCHVNTDGSI